MVKLNPSLFAITAVTLLSIFPLAAKEPADYRVGDTAEEDVTTPIPLAVIDAEATRALKERESRRGIIVFCFYPDRAVEAEAAFHSAFTRTRSNFLNAVELVFHRRRLGLEELSSTNFQEFLPAFQKQNNLFPVEMTLAALWVGGQSDEPFEAQLLEQLRQTMRSPVRSDYVPPGIKVGTTVRLLTITNTVTPTVEMAADLGRNLNKTNLTSIPRSKMELQDRFPAQETKVAKYVATFIKPNCFIDVELTHSLQLKNIEALWTGDNYAAGQLIVKRGQVVDQKIKAALDELKEKTAASRLHQIIADNRLKAAQAHKRTWLLIAGFSAGFVISIAVVWRLARRRLRPALLPLKIAGDDLVLSAGAPGGLWERRALMAEQRAQRAHAVLRAGLLPHLAHLLKTTLVRGLISQRSSLLNAQLMAAAEMAELERRLDELQAPLQERMRVYEKRIEELEKALAAKGEENRELIKAKIQLAKQQLVAQRTRNRVEFN
jgi:hypothetical protein